MRYHELSVAQDSFTLQTSVILVIILDLLTSDIMFISIFMVEKLDVTLAVNSRMRPYTPRKIDIESENHGFQKGISFSSG